jgi:hypothetical protein
MIQRLAAALFLVACVAVHANPRSPALRAEFQRLEPCPATGQPRGPCPGFQVDHVNPLCLTGPGGDMISNLQWLSIEDHKRKTVRDIQLCRQAH